MLTACSSTVEQGCYIPKVVGSNPTLPISCIYGVTCSKVANDAGSIVEMGSILIGSTINRWYDKGIYMDNYMNWLGALLGLVGVLFIYNKIVFYREMKKMEAELKKKLDYHKRPSPGTFRDGGDYRSYK